MTELKNRGVEDVLIAVVDGLKGFPQAINAVFPQAQIQTCIVHLIRNSLDFVGWKERKLVAAELKNIYRATTEAEAAQALESFAASPWGLKLSNDHGDLAAPVAEVIPFFAYPLEVRRIMYTTDEIYKCSSSTVRRCLDFPVGQHDNYGFALAAQPGGSQGRPTTNTSSRLIV
jgi:putative transposase